MITKNSEGRLYTVRTLEEEEKELEEDIERLSTGERKLLEACLDQHNPDSGNLIKLINDHQYERKPVSMEQFLDDPYYLGESCKTLYPKLRKDLTKLFDGSYREVIMGGGIGCGKTYVASIAICRQIYELSCFISPQSMFGLSPSTEMAIVLFSKTLILARGVLMSAIEEKIKMSPYFIDVFPFKIGAERIKFPKNIVLIKASYNSERMLGVTVFGGVMDEANFAKSNNQVSEKSIGKKITAADYDRAEQTYRALMRRIKSRFVTAGGNIPGMLILLSSATTSGSFIERRVAEMKNDPSVYITDNSQWEVKPMSNFSGKMFKVLCGNQSLRSRILADGEDVEKRILEEFNARVIEVPDEYRVDFESNIEDSIRDIAGIATNAISAFIQRVEKVDERINHELRHPYSVSTWRYGDPGGFIWERLASKRIRELRGGVEEEYWVPLRNPDAMRYVHIDTSLSGDATGICMGHVSHWMEVVRRNADGDPYTERAPYIVIDFMLQVLPLIGEQIFMGDMRAIVYDLVGHGFSLIGASMDMFQCLAGGTLVSTTRGMIPICNVRVGDIVQSRSGPNKVLNVWSYHNKQTLEIVLKGGLSIEGTYGHRIEVQVGWKSKVKLLAMNRGCSSLHEPVFEWKKLEDLRAGDVVRVNEDIGLDSKYIAFDKIDKSNLGWRRCNTRSSIDAWDFPEYLDENMAEFTGMVFGNGVIDSDSVRVVCHIDNTECVAKLFERVFGVYPRVSSRGNTGLVRVSARWLLRWLDAVGLLKQKTNGQLRVPSIIYRSPISVRLAFLRGLLDADGNVGRMDGYVSLSTKYLSLAKDVQVLLQSSIGISTAIVKSYREGYGGKSFQYIVGLSGSRKKILDNIGFSGKIKRGILEENKNIKGRKILARVKEISGSRSDVYDLEVENDPSYVANGFISHNSAEGIQRFKKQGIPAEVVSVDRTTEPYDMLKSAIYEDRIEYYNYPPFLKEVKALEIDRVKGKVDHPLSGSKDCISGDTFIPMLDGTEKQIKDLVDKEFWLYSCAKNGEVVPGFARNVHNVGNREVVRLWFDNDEFVECTYDHEIMLMNGEFIEAKNVVVGDSLMPSYRENGFEKYSSNCIVSRIKKNIGVKPVYDLTVDTYHNFAISSGVFVHNCSDAVAGVVYGLNKKVSSMPLGVIQHGTGSGESEGDYSWVMKNRTEPVLAKGKTGLYHREDDDFNDDGDDGDDGLMPFVMGD